MEYKIEIKYKKVKYLRMRVKNGIVMISAPLHTSKAKIQSFILRNQSFIEKNLLLQQQKQERRLIKFGDEQLILNKKYQILPINGKSKITDHFVFIQSNCQEIRKEIKKVFKQETLNYFRLLTLKYYEVMNLTMGLPDIVIKDVKSRYGSYNKRKHVIMYASELIFKEPELCKLVVIHELSHLIEFNHSAKFYAILAKYCPNYKELTRKLKEN